MIVLWPQPELFWHWQEWAKAFINAVTTALTTDSSMTGAIQEFQGTVLPSPWLKADGSSFSSAAFPALAARLGGTTLPNLSSAYGTGHVVGIHP